MKQKIKDFIGSMKEAFGGLRVTLIIVALVTLWFSLFYNFTAYFEIGDTDFNSWVLYISFFLGLFAFGSFFTETTFRKKGLPKFLSFIVTGFLSAAFTVVFVLNPLDFSSELCSDYIVLYALAYVVITVLIGVYFCYRNSGLRFNQYALGVFMNGFRIGIITSILSTGMILIVFSIMTLFDSGENLLFRFEILIFGLVSVPGILFSVRNAKEESGTFAKVLTSYVAFPILVLGYMVIYVYLTKILVTWNLPSNSLFLVISILYFIAIPVLTLTEHANQSAFFKKAIRILYLATLPFIAMQIYCLGIRIFQYGITPSRYIGIVAIVIELIYLILSIFGANIRGLILPAVSFVALLALIVPGVNVNAASRRSQTAILKRFDLSGESELAGKAYGAYEYLLDLPEEIPNYLTRMEEEERTELLSRIIDAKTDGGEELIVNESFYDNLVDGYVSEIDISGYSHMIFADGEFNDYDNTIVSDENYPEALTSFKLNEGLESEVSLDVTALIDSYYRNRTEESYLSEEERYVKIDESHILYLTRLDVSGEYLEDGTRDIESVYVEGWLFTK